jgi:acyl carrier protein
MTPDEKLRLLRSDVDLFATAQPDTPLASLPDWGSLAILLIIVHLEEKHRLTVSGAQIRACRTVADLLALIP